MRYKKQKHITRIESGATNTWWVRFHNGSHTPTKSSMKTVLHKAFSDLRHGSKAKAYRAAIAWRDEQLEKGIEGYNYGMKTTKAQYFKSHPRNTTGVVGVSLVCRKGRLPAYIATWRHTTEKGKRPVASKSFSFEEGNEKEKKKAFKLAKRHRLEMQKIHYTGARKPMT